MFSLGIPFSSLESNVREKRDYNEVTEDGAPRSFIHDGFLCGPKALVRNPRFDNVGAPGRGANPKCDHNHAVFYFVDHYIHIIFR